jgi:hypothetical protein
MQESSLADPATSLNQFLMHHGNLPSRPAKAYEAELKPVPEGLPKAGMRWALHDVTHFLASRILEWAHDLPETESIVQLTKNNNFKHH